MLAAININSGDEWARPTGGYILWKNPQYLAFVPFIGQRYTGMTVLKLNNAPKTFGDGAHPDHVGDLMWNVPQCQWHVNAITCCMLPTCSPMVVWNVVYWASLVPLSPLTSMNRSMTSRTDSRSSSGPSLSCSTCVSSVTTVSSWPSWITVFLWTCFRNTTLQHATYCRNDHWLSHFKLRNCSTMSLVELN